MWSTHGNQTYQPHFNNTQQYDKETLSGFGHKKFNPCLQNSLHSKEKTLADRLLFFSLTRARRLFVPDKTANWTGYKLIYAIEEHNTHTFYCRDLKRVRVFAITWQSILIDSETI